MSSRTWRRRLDPTRTVTRLSDGSLWVADGKCPVPFFGWNFARAVPAPGSWWRPAGWRIDHDDRWATLDRGEFRIGLFRIEGAAAEIAAAVKQVAA